MKRIFTLSALFYGAIALNAQNVNPLPLEFSTDYNGFVPASLSSDGSAKLTFQQPDNILVYNNQFELESTIRPITQENNAGGQASVVINMPNLYLNIEEWGFVGDVTLEEAKRYIMERCEGSTYINVSGQTYYGEPISINSENFGCKYIFGLRGEVGGDYSQLRMSYGAGYWKSSDGIRGDLHYGYPRAEQSSGTATASVSLTKETTNSVAPYFTMSYISYSDQIGTGTVALTQTLFNSDNQYEYLAPKFGETTASFNTFLSLNGMEAGGTMTITSYSVTGFEIRNNTSTPLQAIDFPQGFSSSKVQSTLIQIGGKYYLQLANAWQSIVYGINRTVGKVNQLCDPFEIMVSPKIVKKGQNVNVTHGDGRAHINICGLDGILRHSGASGEGTVTEINTANLNKGLNIVEVLTDQGAKGTSKIIVE